MKLRGEAREEMKLRVSRMRITDVIEDCMMYEEEEEEDIFLPAGKVESYSSAQ
jgi:hypothetical protein